MSKQNYEAELIQVAAVAVAAIQNLRNGSATLDSLNDVYRDVTNERISQFQKWGAQDRHPFTWMTILGEEFGETCEAALKAEFDDHEGSLLSEPMKRIEELADRIRYAMSDDSEDELIAEFLDLFDADSGKYRGPSS